MAKPTTSLPPVILRRLRTFHRARKRTGSIAALAEGLILYGLGVLAVALVEALAHPGLGWRVVLSCAIQIIAGSWLIIRFGNLWLRRASPRVLARDFEAAAGFAGQEKIWSAVDMSESADLRPGVSRWMVDQTIAQAAREIETVDPRRLVDRRPLARVWSRAAAVAVVILGCVVVGMGGRVQLAVDPYASALPLSRIKFLVTPGNCALPEGTNLVIVASASRLPERAKLDLIWADGVRESIAMTQTGTNLFQSEVPSVTQSFRYQITAEQAESPVFNARVLSPPRLSRLAVRIEPPAYTHWTNQVVEGGNADFIAGSKITVELRATGEPVERAEFYAPDWGARPFVLDQTGLKLSLDPTNRISFGARLVGRNQLVSETPPENTLNPMPDLPPSATLAGEGLGQGMVERDEVLPLTVQASDDVGLSRVDLVISSPKFPRVVRNLFDAQTNAPNSPPTALRDFAASPSLVLPEFKTAIGDELQLVVVATDLKGQTNLSNLVGLTIGTSEKALEARMAARLRGLMEELEAAGIYWRQTRSSWTSAGRNYREMDPGAGGATLALVKSRVGEFAREVGLIGEALVGESKTNDVNEARFIYRLGTSISTWAKEQATVVRGEVDRLDPTRPEEAPAIFSRGRDLFQLAASDLTNFTRVVTILQGTFETDVLATRCETAQGRYKRGLPVLRGDSPQGLDSALNPWGLDVTFFEGTELKGRVLEKKIDLPRFENYAPDGRKEQWSCRYEGDLQIWEPGGWTLACVADDGVRITLDGEPIMPAAAWGAHSANEYKTNLDLHTGWHPFTIEYFQGYSLSKLQILLGKQSNPLHEIPAFRLRPRSIRAVAAATNNAPAMSPETKELLRSRVATSLQTTSIVPATLSTITNTVDISDLSYMVANRVVTGVTLSNSIPRLPLWGANESAAAERAGDALTLLSQEAQQILRTELDKYRWRYEGSAALKAVQTAIEELRSINEQLRRLPWNQNSKLDEKEQDQVAIAQAWEKELARATQNAAHQFFEEARRKDSTLAERTWALQAATKTAESLAPAVGKLEPVLAKNQNKNKMSDEIDRRLNEISERYRELNETQERMNREHVAALARRALPPVRAFARAQKQGGDPAVEEKFEAARSEASAIAEAQRVAGDYRAATRLEALAGDSAKNSDGDTLAKEVRSLAAQTDNNPPSLARSIPPPMQKETAALAARQENGAAAAERLAVPRLAMTLEAARLARRGDPNTATAFELLGQDLGEAMNAPDKLDGQTLQPLTERALALAGAKGEEAKAAEVAAAKARIAKMAPKGATPPGLAAELDALSGLSKEAARDDSKDRPLLDRLTKLTQLAPAVRDWAESTDSEEVAASASHDSKEGLVANPKGWEAHQEASEILADAAKQVRLIEAQRDLDHHDPFPSDQETPPAKDSAPQPSDKPSDKPGDKSDQTKKFTGEAGHALTQETPGGLDQAEWAKLNQRLQKNIRNGGTENFTEEQRAAIQAYFEKLGSSK